MNTEPALYDVVISGGGLAGASLAIALAENDFKVAVIEAKPVERGDHPSFDVRAIALTLSSGAIFRNLGVWKRLDTNATTPIQQIEITDFHRRGKVNMHASDVGAEALGWNVEAAVLGDRIYQRLGEKQNVTVFSPARVSQTAVSDQRVEVCVQFNESQQSTRLVAKLFVVADGGTAIRSELGFKVYAKAYRQKIVVCRVDTDRPNRNKAYEHFIRSGPLALLPVGDTSYSVVWTAQPDETQMMMTLPSEQFLSKLQQKFAQRVGEFRALTGERKSYPLALSKLHKFVRPRVVVVGNASHTVHPVAGQGFNLALRDAAALAQVLAVHRRRRWDIGSYDVLANYERWRTHDSHAVTWFTDSLIRVFANDYPLLSVVRNLGLDVVQTMPSLKKRILMRTIGFHGKQPDAVVEDFSAICQNV